MGHKEKNQLEILIYILVDLLIIPLYRIPRFLMSKKSLRRNFSANYKRLLIDICGFSIVISCLYFMGFWQVCLIMVYIMVVFHYVGYLRRKNHHEKTPEFTYQPKSKNTVIPPIIIPENKVRVIKEPKQRFDAKPIIIGLQNLGYSHKLASSSAEYVRYNFNNAPLETQMLEAIKHMNTV